MSVHLLDHPLATDLLTEARDRETTEDRFEQIMHTLGVMLAMRVLSRTAAESHVVQTPLGDYTGIRAAGRTALVPVLRAGDALLPGFNMFLRHPFVWHLGFARNEETLQTQVYLDKIPREHPPQLSRVILLEIMLATGGSACRAIELAKQKGYEDLTFVAVLGAQEGVDRVFREHPDVELYLVEIDQRLTTGEDGFPPGFIFPGLGDAGDRLYPVT